MNEKFKTELIGVLRKQIEEDKITTKEALVQKLIGMENKILNDPTLTETLRQMGITVRKDDYKECLDDLFKIFEQHQDFAADFENVSKVEIDDDEYIQVGNQFDGYKLVHNQEERNIEESFNDIDNGQLKQDSFVSQNDILEEFANKNTTIEFYGIEELTRMDLSVEQIQNLSKLFIFLQGENLNARDFEANFECDVFQNQITGEVYNLIDGKLVHAKRENTESEQTEVPKENKEEIVFDDDLDRISYTDDELLEMLAAETDPVRKEKISSKITLEKDQNGNFIKEKSKQKVFVREPFKEAAFVNILVLSLISFFTTILTILFILIKIQG